MQPFRIAINMAGAVSAGAYTAGVLDFLAEALDQWQAARDRGEDVPQHEVSIEALSGASAGGMCAAIWTSMLQEQPSTKLFDAWVNAIDIRRLLTTSDLKDGLVSLLDSSVIETIARDALTPGLAQSRPYVSPHLTLFLTLTNLRGVPYALFEGPTRAPDEFVSYHADRLRFEMVEPGAAPLSPDARPLTRGGDGEWELLRTAAMATGAFPAFLAPRAIVRTKAEYERPLWEPIGKAAPHPPAFPDAEGTWTTVNVDGGVINNSPFALAFEYLNSIDPENSAVITVAPFPGCDAWNGNYNPARERGLIAVLTRLVSTLLAQARFFGESLDSVTRGPSPRRYFIAPSDRLQCGTLGAFGGFFERSFRARDFQLGRRNCQRFLETSFLGPGGQPLIPLVGTARVEVTSPALGSIARDSLGEIVDLVAKRANALLPLLVNGRLLRWGARLLIAGWGKRELRAALERGLEGFISG